MSAGVTDIEAEYKAQYGEENVVVITPPPTTDRLGEESYGRGPTGDDIAQAHVGKLSERETDEALAEFESLIAEPETEQGGEPGAGGSDAKADGESDQSVEDMLKAGAENGEQWWQTVLRNVSPAEMLGGALDYADNAFETARMISAKGDEALMGLGVPALTFGPDGVGTTTDFAEFEKTQNIGDALPDIGDPNKPGLARSVGKFVAGYATAGRALSGVQSLRTLAQSGRFGQSAVAALKGAMSDFSGLGEMEGNLANLVEDFPALQNPITDFLAADDETPELVNKMKTALVGAGIGMAVDGVMAGLRTIRASRQLANATDEMDKLASGLINEAEMQRGMLRDALGDPDDARLLIEDVADEGAEAGARAAGGATNPRPNAAGKVGDVYVNWARIDSEDDVKSVIQQLANRFSDSINEARGGVQNFADTEAMASTEDAWKLLTERAKGQPMNAAQTLAVRRLWTSSGTAVKNLARRVEAGGSVADQIALKKMIAVHATIQEQVIGIRTETARALAQWRIPAGESDQFLNGMANLMDMMGTDRDVMKIAARINDLADMGRNDAADAFILGASKIDDLKRYGANASDMIRQLFYFSLLSGPKTHVRNSLSNSAMLLANVIDRRGAALLGEVLGGQNVPNEEAAAMMYGQINGIVDAFRISDYAREVAEQSGKKARNPVMNALLTGQSGVGIGKVEMPRAGAFSSEKLALDPKSNIGRVLDFIDTTTKVLTTNAMAAADEVFRTSQYNGEVHALSFRKAWQEAQSGLIAHADIQKRATELARSPDLAIKTLAEQFAERSIFANRPPADSKLYRAITSLGNVPIVGKLMMPFRKTVYNIFIETAQRTPMALGTKHFWTEIQAGGARADIAWTKFLTGNAALIALADVAVKGGLLGGRRGIGGEESAGEMATDRAMGRTPMSIPFKNKDGSVRTFSFRGLEPVSTHLGMAANVVEILSSDQFDADDKDIEDIVIAATAATAMQITNPSFMTGMMDMMNFVGDPLRQGETFFERTAGIAVPNAIAEVARAQDPVVREVNGMIDAIKAKTPGLSKTLPANTDRWGNDLRRDSGLGVIYDAASPFSSTLTKPTPIDIELDRLQMGLAKPTKRVSFGGVPVNMKLHPHEFTRYVKLAGNEMTEDVNGNPIMAAGGLYVSEGQGLRDELSAIVEGRHTFSDYYAEGSDEDKAEAIQSIVNAFRKHAKAHLLLESPALAAKVRVRQSARPESAHKPDKGNEILDMIQ